MELEFWKFCSAVTDQIRFTPDRAAVEEELMAHLEDRRDAYMSRGMTQKDAKEQAVRSMGDPEEIGRALNRLHSPWLGWFRIWFSRVVVVVSIVTAFTLLLTAGDMVGNLISYWEYGGLFAFNERGMDQVTADFQPDAEWQYGGYTFTIQRAIVVYQNRQRAMYYQMKESNLNPWIQGPEFRDWLWAQDDLGNHYPCRGEGFDGSRDSAGNPSLIYPFASFYDLWVTGIDPNAKEITLCFDRYGEAAILLTVPLEGGNGDG